jgi:hypothetical protein
MRTLFLDIAILLRILNPSEKGAETRSSQAPTADRRPLAAFISRGLAVPLVYMFVSSHVLANVANALRLAL